MKGRVDIAGSGSYIRGLCKVAIKVTVGISGGGPPNPL